MTDSPAASAAAQAFQPSPRELHDRIILISGAGSGIGRAAAHAFAAHGATVLLLGRRKSQLESVYDEICAAGHPTPAICVLDLAKAQGPGYFTLAEQVQENFGRLDGLLHNAAILGHRAPIEHYDISVWHEVMHLNLNAPFILTQILHPLLRASRDASVVFTSSGVGRRGRAFWGAYAVSKFGVEGLAQVMADERSDRSPVRANCINPGRTRTAMRRAAYPGEDPATLPEAGSLMGPYVYLMSTASRDINGLTLDCQ